MPMGELWGMDYFFERFTRPILEKLGVHTILEVGASKGEHTDVLLTLAIRQFTIVDPCLDADLSAKYTGDLRIKVIVGASHDVLPELQAEFDCIIIDGDHNWYTVYNELRFIAQGGLLAPAGVVLFHDVGWPYGRRDLYYRPDLIPSAFRHPYAMQGIVRGVSELSPTEPFNAHLDNATHEGGPKNGVLTAIEDFVNEAAGKYVLRTVDEQHGLGIMVNAQNEHIRFIDALIEQRAKEKRSAEFRAKIQQRSPTLYGFVKKFTGRG
jgi:hypothetical protein